MGSKKKPRLFKGLRAKVKVVNDKQVNKHSTDDPEALKELRDSKWHNSRHKAKRYEENIT